MTPLIPQSPLLELKDYSAESVFQVENMLREARRQKGLPLEPVPSVCVLDPDGDIVRRLRGESDNLPSCSEVTAAEGRLLNDFRQAYWDFGLLHLRTEAGRWNLCPRLTFEPRIRGSAGRPPPLSFSKSLRGVAPCLFPKK